MRNNILVPTVGVFIAGGMMPLYADNCNKLRNIPAAFISCLEAKEQTMQQDLKQLQESIRDLQAKIATLKSSTAKSATVLQESQSAITEPVVLVEPVTLVQEPEMVTIPAGCFLMGSAQTEVKRGGDEGPQQQVCLQSFKMGKYELTFAEYDAFAVATARTKPYDNGWGRDRRPVINITGHDAFAYAAWLSKQIGKKYRLPTEAEWEYAARAGSTEPFWTGDCISTTQANYDGNFGYNQCKEVTKTGVYLGQTLPVGSLAANPWGLYDVAGNVWELTCSRYQLSYDSGGAESHSNPSIQGGEGACDSYSTGNVHVRRGGSWSSRPRWVRSANRSLNLVARDSNLGVRLVQD